MPSSLTYDLTLAENQDLFNAITATANRYGLAFDDVVRIIVQSLHGEDVAVVSDIDGSNLRIETTGTDFEAISVRPSNPIPPQSP